MKAVIYARYSSDNQREESIEGQIRECMEFAERNGIVVFGTYIDRALSAKTDNRPEFQRMIKDSYRKLFDTVLVWKLADLTDVASRKRLVESFVNAVFVYDDKVVFTFNYKDGSKTATIDEISAELGSDLDGSSPPNATYTHTLRLCQN